MSVPIASNDLIGEIYEASSRPEHWQAVLGMIAEDISADSATLIYRNFENPESNIGYVHTEQSPEECAQMVMEYENYYHHLDPMWKLTNDVGQVGVGIADSLLGLSREEYEAQCPSEYLENYMRKYDRWYVGGSYIFQDDEKVLVIAVQRGAQSHPWTKEDMDYLTSLTPHLERAFRIHHEFVDLRTSVKQLQTCINRLLMGLIIIRPDAKISFINEPARRILAENPVLTINNDTLKAIPSNNDARLQELIRSIDSTLPEPATDTSDNVTAIALKADGGSAPLPMLITPISYSLNDIQEQKNHSGTESQTNNAPSHHIAIFFADPNHSQQYSQDMISEFYGLTRAEAGVAIAISNGYTVSEYANKNKITEYTVRTQIKHIFQKLNVSRQAELVKVLLQTPNITVKKNLRELPQK
ncbi:MAG: helix-turn-helix transcriptional regulator [Thiolinea sp.]